jgi:hypothetical protein
MRATLYSVIPFFIAVALRLYPTLLSGLPYSTDGWPIIRNTELLIENTPISLDDAVFDGYNNYWPASSIFGAVLTQITGLKPLEAMAVGIPLAGAITILILYALVRALSGNHVIAFIAALLLATGYPHVMFTAGVTKETFANPIYMLSIFIFLARGGWRKTLLFTIASIALASSHHLTAIITIAALAAITLAKSLTRFRQGIGLEKTGVLNVSILATATALYFIFFAYKGFKIAITASDLISAASYQAAAFTLALHSAFKPHAHPLVKASLTCAAVATASMIAFISTKTPIFPDAPIFPNHYMIYAMPFILSAPLATLGFWEPRSIMSEWRMVPVFWAATILGAACYAVFGNSPIGLSLAFRTLNFLWPPLAFLCAVGFHGTGLAVGCKHKRRLKKTFTATALLLIAAMGSYSLYASVSLQERYMTYFWLFRPQEYEASAWISTVGGGQVVSADVKTSYLLQGYFNVSVDVLQGLRYLTGKTRSEPKTLYIYDQMLEKGYVLYGGYSVDLPLGWMEKTYDLNTIYSNGFVKVVGSRGA